MEKAFKVNGPFSPPPFGGRITPCTNDIKLHISFDYAQQVNYPQVHVFITTIQVLIILKDTLPEQSITARADLFFNTKEVRGIWCLL